MTGIQLVHRGVFWLTGQRTTGVEQLPRPVEVSLISQRDRRIGIISALHIEARPLAAYPDLVVRLCGVAGPDIAGAVRELADKGCGLIVSWGMAGALSPRLRAGDLALPGHIVGTDGEKIATDAAVRGKLYNALSEGRRITQNALLESPCMLGTAVEKRRFKAQRDGDVVDMESGRIARACATAGVPFVVLRAIIDHLDDRLPHHVTGNPGPDGDLRRAALAATLLKYPAEWGPLLRLAWRYRHARSGLNAAARALAALE